MLWRGHPEFRAEKRAEWKAGRRHQDSENKAASLGREQTCRVGGPWDDKWPLGLWVVIPG